ncbi:conjugal transfer protein TraW [Salmonella enterica subsp. enterica serovar Ajiobo]|nr:conjugal transfer protein [Salmonella enterica subsp. enterica serovar Ajiobo]EDN5730424.1 conjugal transfer protein TraW [Salmonella enterica subsp. enterica serovar Ajiobo]EEE8135662.1 conjugal transfer protein TraW [Salmonella enterica subsp. enterica serovar Ajiobo]
MFRKKTVTMTAALLGTAAAVWQTLPAHAYAVTVEASIPVTTQILPEMGAIQGVLGEILSMQTATGTAINQNAEKLAAVIAENGQATRQQMIFGHETQRLEEARQSFTVPDSICSESASGVAAASKASSATTASRLSNGGGISNRTIRERVTKAADSPSREAYDGAVVHAEYCTAAEYARFGGTAVCPKEGDPPGGDSRVRSVYDGAGGEDTPPALTWDQKQIDAAMAYMKNTARPSAGRTPGKGEVSTQSGRTYVGLQNEYNGIIDAASHPQLALIADSTPDKATKDALAEALQSDSAAAYFDQVASPEAKARGYMSAREFESFEAGRRYANTAYQTDLQEMQGDNLLRELVRTTAQLNWQLNDLKEQIREGNVIAGQQLALSARQYYEQRLHGLESTISQGMSK